VEVKLNKKQIFIGEYYPKRNLAEFIVEKKNIPDSLAKITKLLSDININLLSGRIASEPDKNTSVFCFIADLTNLRIKPEEIAKKLSALDVVLNVKYKKSDINGLIVDDMHFPLLAISERSLLFRVETIKNMFDRLYEEFGTGAAVVIHNMGIAAGERKAMFLSSKYKLKGRNLLKIIFAERVSKGWGIPRLIKINEDKAVVRVDDLFECYPFKGKLKEPRSQFFRGYLRGVFKVIFGKDVNVVEKYCIAKGDEYCEFYISEKID
jgi:predicted hydrocarbon binding protein